MKRSKSFISSETHTLYGFRNKNLGVGAFSIACRYFYRNGMCANSLIEAVRCVGERNCTLLSRHENPKGKGQRCEYDLGYGLYCKKYQRFYSAGTENCGTIDDYMKSFGVYKEKVLRRG